jgi:hypothetical protein
VKVGWPLVPFLIVGPLLVVGYNFELLGGLLHNDIGFAASWGAFPLLTAFVAQSGRITWAALVAALAVFALSMAQRTLSTPARMLRRRAVTVEGRIILPGGEMISLDHARLLAPIENALRSISFAVILFATSLAVFRLT